MQDLSAMFTPQYSKNLQPVADEDVKFLLERDKTYGSSWQKRGGIGAFMMLARKWDRLENIISSDNLPKGVDKYDIFAAMEHSAEMGDILDDIQDLRRYLLLVEARFRAVEKARKELPSSISGRAINHPHPFGYEEGN